jgi:type III secretory pathway component EscV
MFVFTLDPALVVQLLLAVILPIAVGLVTTRVTSSAKKAWLLAGLTLVTSLLTGIGEAIATSAVFDLGKALLLALPAFCISVAMYYGLWKPTGVGRAAQDVEVTTLVK